MPGRKFLATSSSKYRYSINGQEKESELNENITTAQFWEYDSRIVRRWNRDPRPITGISQYAAFINNPINFSDPLGDTCINGQTYEGANAASASTLENIVLNSQKNKSVTSNGGAAMPAQSSVGLWDQTKDITGKAIDVIVESSKQTIVFAVSAANSIATNAVGGIGRYHPPTTAGVAGAKFGDAISVIGGVIETLGGGALMVGSGATLVIPVVGEVTAPVGIAAGGAAVLHGTVIMIPTAWNNLMKSEEIQGEAHTNPPDKTESPIVEPPYSKTPPADGAVKLKNGQGWRDSNGNIWKKDQLHKDHWDISDSKGNKIREVDYNGNQIWPGGAKNKNK